MLTYFNGSFVPRDEVHVSPDDRGWLFADGVYEVIRSYGGRPLAVDAHRRRLEASLRAIRLDWPASGAVPEIVDELLRVNELATSDALIYLQVTRGAAPRGHAFPRAAVPPTVYASVTRYVSPHDPRDGVSAILVPDTRWARCDIKTVGLLPNVLALQQAVERDAAEALFVRDGVLMEGTHSNACAVMDGALCTAPLTNYVLPGVTRSIVRGLCEDLGIRWRECSIFGSDLERCEEVVLLGTTFEVMPVVRIDGVPVADGRPGRVARALSAAYEARARG